MDRKDRIIQYINLKEYIPLTFDEFMTMLEVPKEDTDKFLNILNSLENEGKITITKKGRYIPINSDSDRVVGKLRCNGRGFFAFLLPDNGDSDDVYVSGENLANAIDSDRVIVQIDGRDKRTGRREGHVLKILERGNKTLTGILEQEENGICSIKCDNERIYKKIFVESEHIMGAEVGERIVVELTDYKDNGEIYGMVIKVLGDANSIKANIEAILYEHLIKQEFEEETIKQAENTKTQITEEDLKGRLDLRDKIIFTIDGDDARDFDDAVSVDILENGNYKLGVHIADVTHYVTEGSPLDVEAFVRGTSVYLADRVIPMLPKILSNGICSLNPRVDRLTLSIFMEINKEGIVVSHNLEKSVICSVERMTYNDVTKLLDGDDEKLNSKYEHIIPILKTMAHLASILHQKREKRGSINFDFPESAIVVNDMGEPIEIVGIKREVSHKLIEEFMLAANETVAEYAFWSDIPFVYRVHEPPSIEKIEDFNRFINNFGIMIKGKIDEENPVHPKALQQILEKIEGTPEERMIATYMLRSLMKARYTPQNLGHFGLAAQYYTHFTSPIRRYPDLAIHRILKEFIDGKLDEKRTEELKGFTVSASEVSSEREVDAEMCERDVDDLMKAAYMSQFIGESFEGTISGITNFGMFVELDNSVEGLIRLEKMQDDYYNFDEKQKRLIGERTKKIYKVGDKVEITVVRTDLLSRQIDFMFAKDATEKNIRNAINFDMKKRREKEDAISRVGKAKIKKSNNFRNRVKKTGQIKKRKG